MAGQGSTPVAVSEGDRQINRVLLVEGDKEYANSLIAELSDLINYESLAFERGAMDFIEKSRGVETFVRRRRRAANATDNGPGIGSMTHGRLPLLRHVSRALLDGVDLRLTVGAYNIVELLVLNTGDYVNYRAIFDVLRGPGFLSGRVSNAIESTSARHSNAPQQVSRALI